MAIEKTSTRSKIEIIESDNSRRIRLRVVDADDNDTKITVASVKVYITEEHTGKTVNNRDGTTNTDGITIDDTNRVTFLMDGSDNTIVDSNAKSAYHWVKFEITYGSRMHIIRFKFKIIDV